MTRELGCYNTSVTKTHVRFQFSTHAAAGANVAPNSAFEAADLRIYRANDSAAYSATQRSSAAGITMTSPFDSLTGVHDVDIDLADNTDAGFYAAGYRYSVVLSPDETIDSQTITGIVLAEFEIGYAAGPIPFMGVIDNGTAQSATGTTVVLRAAAAFADDTLIGATIMVYGSTQGYWQSRVITDSVLSTDTVTVDTWTVTPSGTITYIILGSPPAQASGTLPVVNATQIAGKDSTGLGNAALCIAYGTVTTGATTTSIPYSSLFPSGTDDPNQFIGLVMKFRSDTATTGIRCEGRIITGYNDSTNTFTTEAFSSAPASGDLFVIN